MRKLNVRNTVCSNHKQVSLIKITFHFTTHTVFRVILDSRLIAEQCASCWPLDPWVFVLQIADESSPPHPAPAHTHFSLNAKLSHVSQVLHLCSHVKRLRIPFKQHERFVKQCSLCVHLKHRASSSSNKTNYVVRFDLIMWDLISCPHDQRGKQSLHPSEDPNTTAIRENTFWLFLRNMFVTAQQQC